MAAAGRTLGMSIDETIDFINVKIQRNNAKRARQGLPPISDERGFQAFLSRMGRVADINEELPEFIDDKRTIPNSEVEFGEFGNQDELQNFGGRDKDGNIKDVDQQVKELERAQGKKDPNQFTRSYFDKTAKEWKQESIYIPDGMPMPERFKNAAKARDFGLVRQDVPAPAQQVLNAELARLQAGIDQFGAEQFGVIPDPQRGVGPDERIVGGQIVRDQGIPYTAQIAGIADVAGNIEDDLRVNAGAEAALAGEMARRDQANINSEVVEANDWKADADAQRIAQARFGINGGGAAADEALGKIGNIHNLGAVKVHGPEGQADVRMPVPGRQVEPTALPIGLAEDFNAPVTDNRFAGPLQKQQIWLDDHTPHFREGKIFGDFPQVAIDQQFGGVEEAIARLKLAKQGIDPSIAKVRNLNDLQAAADRIIAIGQQRGERFFDRVEGKNVFNPEPGIDQVLNKLRFNENQKNDLARALWQVEVANERDLNVNRKARFAKGKPAPANPNMGGRRLVAIQGSDGKEFRVVREENRKVVGGAQHQNLGAGQVPIGRINREKVEGREIKGELQKLDGRRADPQLDRIELRNARMPDQAVRGGEKAPRARFIKGDVRAMARSERERRFGPTNAAIANNIEDRFLAAEAERRANAPMQNDRGRLVVGNGGAGLQRPAAGLDFGDWYSQEATSAVVNPRASVSPEMGGGSVPPKPPVLTAAADNNIPEPARNGAMQGPRQSMIPRKRSLGERADYAMNKMKGYATSPRFQGRRRVAYGVGAGVAGLAGLDALIGGERESRQQEAMV